MSEGKRVSLQSIGPVKKDKKTKPVSTTIRLCLSLPPCNSETYGDFNYKSLVANERKKKDKDKDREKDGGSKANGQGLDPYASDDEDQLQQIARSFESKYGTPKKKYRRFEDYNELGTGYDESDSFIDNTDAYDEVVPEDQTTECGGFYINKGQLVLKQLPDRPVNDQSDSDDSVQQHDRKGTKRRLSESESDDSDEDDDSEDSEDSDDSEEDENEDEEMETEDSPKEVKSNGHAFEEVPNKKAKISAEENKKKISGEPAPKKAKNKDRVITGLFLKKAVTEKELINEKRHLLEANGPDEKSKHIDQAIEAVAMGEDSKDSGVSKSQSGSTRTSDSEESQDEVKTSGPSNGAASEHPLPDNLPQNLLDIVSGLKSRAAKYTGHKKSFLSGEIDQELLSLDKSMKGLSIHQRRAVYEHLGYYFPVQEKTLLKHVKSLVIERNHALIKEPLSRLKAGIEQIMPAAIERYNNHIKNVERSIADGSKSSPEKIKVPRRRFVWSEDLRGYLGAAVRHRRTYFFLTKSKGQVWEDDLKEFLKTDVLPMWEPGWMKVTSLMDVILKHKPDLLQSSPVAVIQNVKVKKTAPAARKSLLKTGTTVSSQSPSVPVSLPNNQPIVAEHKPTQSAGESVLKKKQSLSNNVPASIKTMLNNDLHTDSNIPDGLTIEPVVKKNVSHLPESVKVLPSNMQGFAPNNVSDNPVEVTVKKRHHSLPSSGPESVPVSINNVGDGASDFSGKKRPTLPNSVSMIMKPSQNQPSVVDVGVNDIGKKHQTVSNSLLNARSVHNVKSDVLCSEIMVKGQETSTVKPSQAQNSGDNLGHEKKRHALQSNASSSLKTAQTNSIQSHTIQTQSALNSLHVHGVKTSNTSPQNPPSIKVSSVAAINLKLSVPPQDHATSTSLTKSQSGKHQLVSTYSTPSVISHSAESAKHISSSSSVTITPVKSNINNNYHQQVKTVPQSSAATPLPAHQSSNVTSYPERSDVIVSSSGTAHMPHIKSSSANTNSNINSSVNFSRSDSSGSYTSLSNLRNESVTSRTPVTPSDKLTNLKAQCSEPSTYVSPRLYSSPAMELYSRSSIVSSPSPVKSVTPSPEKVIVSRKDRILQDSRDRASNDSAMPSLCGPFRTESSAGVRQQTQVINSSLDVYKVSSHESHGMQSPPVLESQRASSMTTPILDTPRMNVVMQTPTIHESQRRNQGMSTPPPPLRETQRSTPVISTAPLRDIPRTNHVVSNPPIINSPRVNVVSSHTTRDTQRINPSKDEISEILAGISSQMINRTDHYTATSSMHYRAPKSSPHVVDVSTADVAAAAAAAAAAAVGDSQPYISKDESLLKAQDLAMRGILSTSRTNCEMNLPDDNWNSTLKKTGSFKPSDMLDQRLSGMSSLSMAGLDGMGGLSLGLPPHMVGFQNEYQRHLYGSTSKSTGQSNDHRPS